jgi:hypothetical protein
MKASSLPFLNLSSLEGRTGPLQVVLLFRPSAGILIVINVKSGFLTLGGSVHINEGDDTWAGSAAATSCKSRPETCTLRSLLGSPADSCKHQWSVQGR